MVNWSKELIADSIKGFDLPLNSEDPSAKADSCLDNLLSLIKVLAEIRNENQPESLPIEPLINEDNPKSIAE